MRLRVVLLLAVAGVLLGAGCDQGSGEDGGQETPAASSTTSANSASSGRDSTPATTTTHSPLPTVFDRQAMQESVRKVLTESYGLADVTNVSCPSGRPVEVGSTFECAVRVAGEPKTVTITVTSEDAEYEVSAPH
ncbi:DUF4333 domain-containing protein [Amycolatopsis cihanbeyliensis]|uniref:Uncharacterized protein DUF4333 n=1 Tax=Amycolatopsis cihanbeyliensis TaxID=1128664 RepID=A0A542DCB9_AMYCI|nr:DUF4333 domain-containing protein [Amycolatopsis cihanbeyliensis]TQJ00712.1 uncharacterized protein DUF4333 [Amycolatopsis cihanbeyliensis]